MQIRFFGGAGEVGRSSFLIEADKKILLDYGIKVEGDNIFFPLERPKADYIILSHAHLDHSGFIPNLLKDSSPAIYGTVTTMKLAELLLEDSIKVAREEHRDAGFSKRQIKHFKSRFVTLGYRSTTHLDGNIVLETFDSGHIPGSMISRLEFSDNTRLVYTGDFKLSKQTLHTGAEIVKSDILIIESTYALREHPDRDKVIDDLIESIKDTIDNNGTALIPSFAVGRAQELLAILYQRGLIDYTYIDGMIKSATDIILRYPREIKNYDLLYKAAERAFYIETEKERKIALEEPAIVLTTSGMLDGGPVLSYIRKINSKSKILLTGYQAEDTNGRSLLERGVIVIDNKEYKIDNKVEYYDLSAHAGMSDLMRYVKESSPHTVICIHGDERETEQFAEKLKEEGFEAYAPKVGDLIELR
ncbi:MAG: ribonuclease J [Candidatus Micrarchaeota archaeon]|nr:MAG: ribonuclease J [Candidatus Micrarchaeota archaeon]